MTEYVKDYNATQSAIRAGYARSSAYQRGYELVKNVDIQQRLNMLGVVSLDKLAQIAMYGNSDSAKLLAALALVERAYGKLQH